MRLGEAALLSLGHLHQRFDCPFSEPIPSRQLQCLRAANIPFRAIRKRSERDSTHAEMSDLAGESQGVLRPGRSRCSPENGIYGI
jgi:hypothetical protein